MDNQYSWFMVEHNVGSYIIYPLSQVTVAVGGVTVSYVAWWVSAVWIIPPLQVPHVWIVTKMSPKECVSSTLDTTPSVCPQADTFIPRRLRFSGITGIPVRRQRGCGKGLSWAGGHPTLGSRAQRLAVSQPQAFSPLQDHTSPHRLLFDGAFFKPSMSCFFLVWFDTFSPTSSLFVSQRLCPEREGGREGLWGMALFVAHGEPPRLPPGAFLMSYLTKYVWIGPTLTCFELALSKQHGSQTR